MKDTNPTGCISKYLSEISISQYATKLYHNGKACHSSPVGGFVTIICALIISTYSLVLILNTSFLKDGRTQFEVIIDIKT